MSDDAIRRANPAAPTTDREFRVWEDGRRQGHREASRTAARFVQPWWDCGGLGCGHQPCICDKPPSYQCPRCGVRSYHPKDVAEQYCGRCHDWTAEGPAATSG